MGLRRDNYIKPFLKALHEGLARSENHLMGLISLVDQVVLI